MGGMKRALHPKEAELLRHLRPALVRAINASRRVTERGAAVQDARRIGDEVVLKHANRALELSQTVQAMADRDLAEAFCTYFGVAPDGDDADLETLYAHSLSVVDGGRKGTQ